MDEKKLKRQIITAYVICGFYLVIFIFAHHIDMLFNINYLLSTLFMAGLFITITVFFVRSGNSIFKNWEHLSFRVFVPLIIYTVPFLYTIFSPYLPTSEKFESKPVLVAYYKGTQNQAAIKFRANHSFELNWSGVFGYNEWFTGSYTQKKDTLILKYKGAKPFAFGSTILQQNGVLITLDKQKDTSGHYVPFKVVKPKS